MNQQLKIGAYAVLLICGLWFGYGFFRNLAAATAADTPPQSTNDISAAATNQSETVTNQGEANEVGATNQATNAVIHTNVAASTKGKRPAKPAAPPESRGSRTASALTYGAGLLAVVICLGFLIAHDFSRFAAHRFEKFIFDEDLEGAKDPEYEEAEKVWANGNFLEAIQLMRDHLKEHPREQYVALRIAEIYEKDLGNYLAAALEYEEILKKKLSAERWGWAAIHLANLYSGKLKKSQQAVDLLQRIVAEYGHTAAAKKARERLVAEGIALPEPPAEEPTAAEESPVSPSPTPPPSNLPPGFIRKKS